MTVDFSKAKAPHSISLDQRTHTYLLRQIYVRIFLYYSIVPRKILPLFEKNSLKSMKNFSIN
ncbi:hypothetical protein HMPREF1992_00497 [Selenomonas sp. oral taxon 892 str. F0426]|nr:hypothetical protein HMPREF1992_00497 [Selenomonas sp. oral taxon 892 str. F0426]